MQNQLKTTVAVLTLALGAVGCGEGQVSGTAGETSDAVSAGKCPKGATVSGVDVSTYQGAVNWGAVHAAGQQFAIARVSDGSYIDNYFAQNWAGMKAAGLLRGAYQFFEPGQDAVAQANIVISRVGRLGAGDLPVMLDVEVTGGQSPATITAKIHQWVNAITAGTGKKPFIYTGAYFWDDNVRSADFAGLALDVAWYGTNCPGTPNAWSNWTFHQYTSSGSVAGIGGRVDVDLFNGTLAQLQAFANGGATSGEHEVKPDLYAVVTDSSGSKMTEVHALNGKNNFQSFDLHAATALNLTGGGGWKFLIGDYNGDGVNDLYAINRRGASGRTEVHVLDGASNFRVFSLHTATPLGPTDGSDTWEFALGDYNRDGKPDLYAIARQGTGSKTTEVHVLSGASNFQAWILHTGTALHETGSDGAWQFAVGDFNGDGSADLFAILKSSSGSGRTEVHVLNGSSNYTTWALHAATPLGLTGTDNTWDFALGDFDGDGRADVYAIARAGTGTKTTEVHVLSASSNFGAWVLHTGTALGQTGSTLGWQFGL